MTATLTMLWLLGGYYVMPYVPPGGPGPDDKIRVDGDLADWVTVPNAIVRDQQEHVTYGAARWKGPEDLSAKIHLAWSAKGIYLAADVTDDQMPSRQTGRMLRAADHVALYLDYDPHEEGRQQVFVAISPTESECYRGDIANIETAGARTDSGYVLEAFVPWAGKPPAMGSDINFEIAVRDTDAKWTRWDKMISLGSDPWRSSRSRLMPLVLGDAKGRGDKPVRESPVTDAVAIAPSQSQTIAFDIEALPKGKKAYLELHVRFDSSRNRASGYCTNALYVMFNGEKLGRKQLADKPAESTMRDGRRVVYISLRDALTAPYAPDFTATDQSASYGDADGYPTAMFRFDVTELIHLGNQSLELHNLRPTSDEYDYTLHIGDVRMIYRRK